MKRKRLAIWCLSIQTMRHTMSKSGAGNALTAHLGTLLRKWCHLDQCAPPTFSWLTMRAFLGSSQQECLGDGWIVGHYRNIQWQKTLAVRGVEIQLFHTILLEQLLHLIKVLLLNSLKESSIALKLQRGTESYSSPRSANVIHFADSTVQLLSWCLTGWKWHAKNKSWVDHCRGWNL